MQGLKPKRKKSTFQKGFIWIFNQHNLLDKWKWRGNKIAPFYQSYLSSNSLLHYISFLTHCATFYLLYGL